MVILGSTGSIGESALKVARDIPERMEVVGLAAGKNVTRLIEQAREFSPRAIAIGDEAAAQSAICNPQSNAPSSPTTTACANSPHCRRPIWC